MNNLSEFLKKFKVLVGDKTQEKKVVQETLLSVLGISVDFDNISIKESTCSLRISPIERTELMLRKTEVLKEVKEKGLMITDFR